MVGLGGNTVYAKKLSSLEQTLNNLKVSIALQQNAQKANKNFIAYKIMGDIGCSIDELIDVIENVKSQANTISSWSKISSGLDGTNRLRDLYRVKKSYELICEKLAYASFSTQTTLKVLEHALDEQVTGEDSNNIKAEVMRLTMLQVEMSESLCTLGETIVSQWNSEFHSKNKDLEPLTLNGLMGVMEQSQDNVTELFPEKEPKLDGVEKLPSEETPMSDGVESLSPEDFTGPKVGSVIHISKRDFGRDLEINKIRNESDGSVISSEAQTPENNPKKNTPQSPKKDK